MKTYRFSYRAYRRPFRRSLQTHHGRWDLREGLLVRLSDGDRHSYGEIAPLPWFGSETQAQARALCDALPLGLSLDHIHRIPVQYSACRFGLASAWEQIDPSSVPPTAGFVAPPAASAYLLPTGAAALAAWAAPWHQGYRTFKWKIGAMPQELGLFERLMGELPAGAKLRLDANGGLTFDAARIWLARCDRLSDRSRAAATVDCLEQPLPPAQLPQMLALQPDYQTPLALDESVATVEQLERCLEAGWRGVVVVKAAIAGLPSRLRQVCQRHRADVIWSSVFETAVARAYIFDYLIAAHPSRRALGFGVDHWFADGFEQGRAAQLWSQLWSPP
ncbi:MAG: o-succinylbenzoate synthase [Elainellaceae cyanobacterium]